MRQFLRSLVDLHYSHTLNDSLRPPISAIFSGSDWVPSSCKENYGNQGKAGLGLARQGRAGLGCFNLDGFVRVGQSI